jgi:FkbM family methyltransferase
MTDEALKAVGRDEAARARIVAALVDYERLHRFTTVRDDVTGPIVDALHASAGVIRKELRNGLVLEFPYRSKIARDFVMSVPEKPDHVWEPQTTKLLLHLAADDVIVGGAYFGDHVIPIADALRGRGTCHAFEADADQAAMLARNAALNALDNVRVHAVALWSDCQSDLTLVGHDAFANVRRASARPPSSTIPVTTIDLYAADLKVGLIMLDLEGGELEVLRGAERVLREHAPHVVFEIHRAYVDWSRGLQNTEVVQYLSSFGYTLFGVRDFQSNVDMGDRPIELVPAHTAYLEGPPHGFNMLAVKDLSILEDERFRITPNVSPKLLLHRDPRLHHPAGGL